MFAIELAPEKSVSALADCANAVEAAGFDAVVASGHYNNRDQFQALTAMAEATETIRVGPGVANPYETHPVTLASRMATLAEFSGGRGLFGIGAGDAATLRNLGIERERPLRRVLETVRVARRLWAGERVDHDGTFRADDAGLNYDVGGDGPGGDAAGRTDDAGRADDVDPSDVVGRDGNASIPVYVGAQGPHMTRMAAKHADGVFYNGAHPDDQAWAADRVEEGLDERPEERGSFTLLAYALTSVAESEAAAREAARRPVAFVAASAPDEVLDRHGLDRERASDVADAISAGAFRDADERVSDAMLDAFCVAGTPETVTDRIDALRAHVDGIVFASPLGPDVETAVGLLADARDDAESA